MFTLDDKRALQTKVDAGVLACVASETIEVDPEEIEETKGVFQAAIPISACGDA